MECVLCVEEYVWRPIDSVVATDRSNDCHHTDNFNNLVCIHMFMNSAPTVFAVEIT